ncbi:poly a polymerase cid pap -related [Holotrichia oblita]|uniref:Poly a polymerase cid pap -related n=1 Tax=Holotrichia oblita TaxID=644536 RepID=A0ACB9TAJ6_HOLOL|nr:poly a polymerase cid pap -related [Holotrichia oblita]
MEKTELFCELCKVKLSDTKSQEAHLMGKKHQLALHNDYVNDKKKRCGVFIGGLPNMLPKEDIMKFLSDLGATTDIYIPESNTFAFVDFKDEKTAQELIMKRHIYFKGKALSVKSRIADKEVTKPEIELEPINESLKDVVDFDEQMRTLLLHLQPNQQKQMWEYRLLCEDLQRCLQNVFPGCRVYPFGSTITRLNFKNSDVDVYVDLTQTPNYVKGNSSQYVKKARNALPKYNLFSNLLAIPKAKTPIVKCVHIQTNVSCDFNFKNMLGVCNSYLIRHYISLAPNLLWVLMVLKYWGRVHEFTGANNKFSNYSLIMMFIFFIQQEPYNVESVETMQKPDGTENMQDGWNGGFKPTETHNSVLANKSILEILQEFFQFYTNFDYNLNPATLTDSYTLYKINLVSLMPFIVESSLCVQDPFEHNHNLTQRISVKFLEDFIAQCKHSANLLQNSENQSAILYKLFTDEPLEGKFKFNNKCEFKIDMHSRLQYIENKISTDSSDKSAEIKKFVLKFQIDVLKEPPPIEETPRDITPVDMVTFHCKGKCNVWESRRAVARDLDLTKIPSVLDREIEISNYISDVLLKDITLTKPIIEFYMTLCACDSPMQMDFTVTNVNSDKGHFKTLCTYLLNRVPYLFNSYEEELNTSVLKTSKQSS